MARRKSPKAPTPTDAHPALPQSQAIGQVLGLALKGKTMAGLAVGTLLSILFKLLPVVLQVVSWWTGLSAANAEQFRALGADPSKMDPAVRKAIEAWQKQQQIPIPTPEPAPPKAATGASESSLSVRGSMAHPEEFGTERDVPEST
jgi:hypothetical protein